MRAGERAGFRILGPVEAFAGHERLDLGPAKQRAVLAVLLIDVDSPVSAETLIDRVWGESPPAQARKVLQAHLSRIRTVLGRVARASGEPAELHRRSGAYRLHIDRERVDLHRARRLVRQAQSADDGDENRAELLSEAVALWQGEPLAGLHGEWLTRVRDGLAQYRLDTLCQWAETERRLGRNQQVIDALGPMVVEHPLLEPLVENLMRALYATGRGGQALDCYARTRERLADQLGTDPGPALQTLHREILRDEVAAPAVVTPTPADRTMAAYRQLPPDIAEFTGRDADVAALVDAGVAVDGDRAGTATTVVAIEGMGGVGKTRLAVHAAHRLAARGCFQDGQLFVDLHGFAADTPADPAAVLESLLRLLGVDAAGIPAELEARSALYRDRLAGRRMLIVLDNAAAEEQIAPLLPGSPSCMVIVTSRRGMALAGVRPRKLDGFTGAEGLALLAVIAGAERVAAELEAARELVASCGNLPLAIGLAAHRLRSRPAWSIAHLAARLRPADRVLDELAFGRHAVESVFAWSYRALEPAQQRVFRLLGMHAGSDCSAASVAALAQLHPARVERILESLLDQHLVQQRTVGRYEPHRLLRAYAARLCRTEDPPERRQASPSQFKSARRLGDPEAEVVALNSVAEAYLHAGDRAAALRGFRQALAVAVAIGEVDEERRARTGISAVS